MGDEIGVVLLEDGRGTSYIVSDAETGTEDVGKDGAVVIGRDGYVVCDDIGN